MYKTSSMGLFSGTFYFDSRGYEEERPLKTPKYHEVLYSHQLFPFSFQDEPSQHDNYFLEKGSAVRPPPAASSQLHSSQSVSQSVPRVDLSQDTPVLSRFSLSQSQSSQGRLRLSQALQPKKKSRMGFWCIGPFVRHTEGRVYRLEYSLVCNNSGKSKQRGWTEQDLWNGSMMVLIAGNEHAN